MIHVIGDSHVMVFSGKEHIPDEVDDRGFLPLFRTYRLGPYTAYQAAKLRNPIESIIKEKVGPDDAVMLCFGEIDCRAHLVKQSEIQGRSLEDVVAECVGRYAQLFDIKEKCGIKLLVWNVPASSREDVENGEYSTYGTCAQRNEAARLFNRILDEECRKRGIVFVSIFDELIDEDGLTRAEYYADAIHLSQRAMPLILDAFRSRLLMDVPLKTAAHGQDSDLRHRTAGVSEPAERSKVLIWCGVRGLAKFIASRPNYDLCYVIEPEEAYLRAAERIFGKDMGVRMFRMASVNLLDFCRQQGIVRIETLSMHTGANDLSLIKTIERFVKKKRVNRIECDLQPEQLTALIKMCGDAYDVESMPHGDVTNEFLHIRCVLKGGAEVTRNPNNRVSPVFNVVYAHLRDEEAYAVRRGNASLIWSRLPLEGCDLYLYMNAHSFAGRQNGLNVLLLQEPAVVLPGQYDETIWNQFDHVITLYDGIVEGREHFTKALAERSGTSKFVLDDAITEGKREREEKYPLAGRIPGICMINGNKSSRVAGELYSKRIEAALWFHEHSVITFDVFGNPPFSLPNYRGTLPADAKLGTLARYRYNLCFENIHHPVLSSGYVDKILSCLETRTIPIYLGAPDIDAYIPRECFIDFRSFRNYAELERFLARLSEEQYAAYIENIDDFVDGGGLRPYSWNTLYDQLVQIYCTWKGEGIEEVCGTNGMWEWGLGPAHKDVPLRELPGSYVWQWDYLQKVSGGAIVLRAGTGRDRGDEAIAPPADRPGQGKGDAGIADLQATMARLQGLIDSGAAEVKDYYLYAQCLLAAKAYEQAIPVLNRVLELLPNQPYALNDLGVISFLKKDFDAALLLYRKSLQAEPHNQVALRNLLVLLRTMGREKEEMTSVLKELLNGRVQDREILPTLEEFGLEGLGANHPSAEAASPKNGVRPDKIRFDGSLFEEIQRSGLWKKGQPLRLHLGCGEQHLEGYVNIDYPPSHHNVMDTKADVFADIRSLDFPSESVDEIRLHHVFEHFNRVTALALLIRWHGWLKVQGVLHIETPDLVGCARTILSNESLKTKMGIVRHLTGDQAEDWAYHVDQWFPERFVNTLSRLGFDNIETKTRSWPKEPYLSNVDVIARKARDATMEELIAGADGILWESTVSDSEVATYDVWKRQLRQALKDTPQPASVAAPLTESDISSTEEFFSDRGNAFPLAEIQNFNQADRDKWVRDKAASIPRGLKVLDIGAGTCPYRASFAHCDYKAHDFKKYDGPKLGNTTEYGEIDYESDIADIPVPGASFDVVLCTEVLEHVPQPEEALREMARILKPGGRVLLTAPLGSGLHQLPYHYYGGFTPEWYKHFMPKFGLIVREITPNGGFFKLLSQECARLTWMIPKEHSAFKGKGAFIHKLFGEWIPRFLYSLDKEIRVDQFTVGYHVEAVKEGQPLAAAADFDRRAKNRDLQERLPERPANLNGARVAGLIFSKDRAMQLDCTLRTLHRHCKDIDQVPIRVIYTTSSDLHERGYGKLKEEFPSVDFVREKTFRDDLLSFVSSLEYVLFLVDDNIFVRDFRLGDITRALKMNTAAIGVSLRLGRNTTYCYMLDKAQRLPDFDKAGDALLAFDWTASEYDFGYPLEVSSSVYRVSDILSLLKSLNFVNPNTLEAFLDASKHIYRQDRPRLLCYGTSVTFCNPANKVQKVCANNRAGTEDRYGVGSLAGRFVEGYRIDVDRYADFTSRSCHQEVELHLVKKTEGCEKDSMNPLVSIVILNANGRKELETCLDSIARNTPESHEVIVLDNGSTDGSPDYLRGRNDVFLIESPINIGVAPGRAKAMAHARGRHIVLLDNDTVVTKGWIGKFLAHLDAEGRIGIVGPRSNYVSGAQVVLEAKYDDVAGLEEFAGKWYEAHRNQLTMSVRLVGFCMFIRREVLDKIGSIDASFGKFGFEDDDYAIRANLAGFKTVIADDVFIHHSGGPQGRGNSQYNTLLMEAWTRFKEKWGIPMETPYGSTGEAHVIGGPFDASKHFIPFMPVDRAGGPAPSSKPKRDREDDQVTVPSEGTAEEHFKKALSYEEGGDIDLALGELEQVVAIDDSHAGAHDGLGVLYYRKGDVQKALQFLSKAVMLRPDNVGYLKNLATVALQVGETEDAIGLYQNILTLDPGDVDALLVVGHLCEQSGQMENAIHFLQRALDKEPGNAQAVEAVERIRKQEIGVQKGTQSAQMARDESAIVS